MLAQVCKEQSNFHSHLMMPTGFDRSETLIYFTKPISFPGLSATGTTIILTNITEVPEMREVIGYKVKIGGLGLR